MSNNNSKFDVIIIGAGVVGLAIAEKLSKSYSNVLVIEKEKKFGQHISSRNSEVIHSGIYYPAGSLKSKLCIKGNKLLYEFMKKYDLPFLNSGKLVIASNQSEEKVLSELLVNAKNNNIENVEIISAEKGWYLLSFFSLSTFLCLVSLLTILSKEIILSL